MAIPTIVPKATDAAVHQPALGPVGVELERRADGSYYLRSPHPLAPYPRCITERLLHWAEVAPERTFMAQRDAGGDWRRISYRQALASARSLGQALLDRELSEQRPLAIVSGNDLDHALLALAALHVGVPFCAVSPSYALQSLDFAKLGHVLRLLQPGLVFAQDGARFAPALAAAFSGTAPALRGGASLPAGVELVVSERPPAGRKVTAFAELLACTPTAEVEQAFARIEPDAVAKILFTSGSTAMPKGVINTQRMLCSNQQQILQSLPFLGHAPPLFVDWLPWNHTFGGNHNYGLALYNGGSFFIDEGRPVPGLIEQTVRNLRELAPTIYFNVPKGFEMLVPHLRADRQLRETFYSQLELTFYAGAHLPNHVREALDELAIATRGKRFMMITGLGATETAPSSLFANWDTERSGMLGLPTYGIELKLAPVEDKLEARVRGPNVMPGYFRQPELSALAFDEEGYYRFGDALKFVDEREPLRGLMFDGRIAEDFKLMTGTWVSVGPLKAQLVQRCAPYVQEAVLAGHDREEVTALLFPDVAACRALCPELAAEASAAQVLASAGVRGWLQGVLDELVASSTGSSNRVVRALLLHAPPSSDKHEITDKGSINQRAVLEQRAELVADLYREPYAAHVVCASTRSGARPAGGTQ